MYFCSPTFIFIGVLFVTRLYPLPMIGWCQSPLLRHGNGRFLCRFSNVGKIGACAVIQHHVGQKMEVRILVVLIVMATDNELVEAIAMPFHVLYPVSDYFFRMSFKRGSIVKVKGYRNVYGLHFE